MKRIIKKAIAVILCMTCIMQFSGQAFAAGLFGKTYIKEVFLSYGYTPEEAKKYLTDNGYEIVDHNLNEGADSALSKKRAVYLGYKTTKDPEEAITDMKLMNMKGNYSVNDYQLLLEDQASQIRTFIDDFITAVTEYRNNYNKGQTRAVTAHDLLNLLYDDDTGIALGDLLLEKIREEYTSREFDALPAEEQAKHADMTTILMQSNATSVYAIELIIALATDSTDSVWLERYEGVESYDAMLDALIEQDMLTPNTAMARLRQYYDDDARAIASKLPEYLEFMKGYTESGITLASSETEIVEHFKDRDSSELLAWYSAGTQYEMLKSSADEDGLTLLDIITDEASDFEGDLQLYGASPKVGAVYVGA
ncbi:MAG: hypothetical protein HUJ65_00250, partial [Oscillospiraceae bacterium]|nr:hypothetical protein [Oscillospiraceae bacterium]